MASHPRWPCLVSHAGSSPPEEVVIRAGSLLYGSKQDVRLRRFKQPDSRNEHRCEDLHIFAGKSHMDFATGQQLGYTLLETDLSTDNGLDNYPFDT